MSVVNQEIQVCQEVQALGAVVVGSLADAKAGKSPAQILADQGPALLAALAGLSQLASEVANSQAFDNSIALFGVSLKQALLPGVL